MEAENFILIQHAMTVILCFLIDNKWVTSSRIWLKVPKRCKNATLAQSTLTV